MSAHLGDPRGHLGTHIIAERGDLETRARLASFSTSNRKRTRLVAHADPRGAFGRTEARGLRRPKRVIAQIRVANLGLADESEQLACTTQCRRPASERDNPTADGAVVPA